MRKSLTVLPLLFVAGTASAQDQDWRYRATLYAWLPALDTTIDTQFGTINQPSGSTSDVLSALDFAFMGTLSAQNGLWGFALDGLYADLSNGKPTPQPLYGDASLVVAVGAVSGYALYRVSGASATEFDLGAGLRSFSLDVTAAVTSGILPAGSQTATANWTDPLIAARVTMPLDDKWFLTGFADFGGTGADNQTYQVYGGVGYAFNESWSTQVGYRLMNVSRPVKDGEVDITLNGFLAGVSYNF
jgi:opacity protein-like surface antigen